MAIYYGTAVGEANQCQGDVVYIVGAANSAGQAALELSQFAKQVVLVVRAGTLTETMSSYLIARITTARNIAVRYHREVVAVHGAGHLESLTLADTETGITEEVPSSWLFIFIGASPRTDWLGPRHRPRREGVRGDRPRSHASRVRTAVAARTASLHARDECAWGIRGRRCSAQFDEAGRLRRR